MSHAAGRPQYPCHQVAGAHVVVSREEPFVTVPGGEFITLS